MGSVPGGDLVLPAQKCPAKAANLGRAGGVLEIVSETPDELLGQVGIVVVIYRPDDFLRVPGGADLPGGVAGVEQAEQLGPAMLVEALVGFGEKPPTTVERIGLGFPVSEGLLCTRRRVSSSLEFANFTR